MRPVEEGESEHVVDAQAEANIAKNNELVSAFNDVVSRKSEMEGDSYTRHMKHFALQFSRLRCGDSNITNNMATALYEAGMLDDAEIAANLAVDEDGENAYAHNLLGVISAKREDYAGAGGHYDLAIRNLSFAHEEHRPIIQRNHEANAGRLGGQAPRPPEARAPAPESRETTASPVPPPLDPFMLEMYRKQIQSEAEGDTK